MLSLFNINEVRLLLKKNNVTIKNHEFIIQSLEYDMWDFKVAESNAKQRDEIKRIKKNTASLLKSLRCLSWGLSTELHEQLEHQFSPESTLDDESLDEDVDHTEFQGIDFKFENASKQNADNRTLQNLYDEGVNDAFSHVPICGEANAIDYVIKLEAACQELIEQKSDSKDKALYQALQSRWDMIGEEHAVKINKANSIEFISVCTGKDLESTKKQYNRLQITPRKMINDEFDKLCSLEDDISQKYIDDWHKLFSIPNFVDSEFDTNIHWILVDSFQSKKDKYSNFIAYLQSVSDDGIRDIIEKYE